MKNLHYILFIAFMYCYLCSVSGQQLEESTAPAAYFNTLQPKVLAWEHYFQEQFFSQGIEAKELGEGTGYLPYLRQRYLYDMRRDYRGETGADKRWKTFKALRSRTFSRNGPAFIANWESVGPNKMEGHGGRMISHAFDPEDSQIIYAGSATGGLWKTENGGDNWIPLTDQIPSTGVGAVAVNPQNRNEILIGTGEGYVANGFDIRPGLGVFKSLNGGLSWEQSDFAYLYGNDVSVFKILWHPTNDEIVWMGATNGIWKSVDGGNSWIQKFGDGTNQATAICDDLLLHPANQDILFAAIERDGIWKSIDGGETWGKSSIGLPSSDMDFISLDLCQSQPDILFASIASSAATGFGLKGLFRSSDGGNSWVALQNVPNAFCTQTTSGGQACQGFYNNIVAVSPEDPDLIWVGGISLWKTVNGGQSWTQHDRTICSTCNEPPACRTYVDQHDFGFDPQNPQTLYVFNDGGIAKSTDGGDCWEQKNEGLVTAHFYGITSSIANPDIIAGGLQDHGLQGVNLAEGDEWDRWGWFDGYDVEVHTSNNNILYGTWITGSYWKTFGGIHTLATQITNGMNLSENSGAHFAPLRTNPENSNILLGCTEAKIYKSENGGSSWTAVANAPNVTEVAFSQADPDHCYAAAWIGNDWRFYHSSNGGDNWSLTANPPGWRITDLKTSFINPGTVYATRNSINPNTAHVYRSIDFGENWQGIQGTLPDIPVNGIALNPYLEGNLYVATDLGVFTTMDDGQTWTEFNDNLPISIVMDIVFNPTDTSLVIGTLGRGAWRTSACPPEPVTTTQVNRPNIGISQILPNPAKEVVQIDYFLEQAVKVKLEVFDVLGQRINTILSKKQASGKYTATWNGTASNGIPVNQGIYFVRLQAENQAVARKVVWQ